MPKIEITEELWKKLDGLTKSMEMSVEEIMENALDAYIMQEGGRLNKKKDASAEKLPETKYTPSK